MRYARRMVRLSSRRWASRRAHYIIFCDLSYHVSSIRHPRPNVKGPFRWRQQNGGNRKGRCLSNALRSERLGREYRVLSSFWRYLPATCHYRSYHILAELSRLSFSNKIAQHFIAVYYQITKHAHSVFIPRYILYPFVSNSRVEANTPLWIYSR